MDVHDYCLKVNDNNHVSNKKPRKKKISCSALNCPNTTERNPNFFFHSIPKTGECVSLENKFGIIEKYDRRAVWDKRLKLSKKITRSSKVCSYHFTKDDYLFPGLVLSYNIVLPHNLLYNFYKFKLAE